MKQINLTSIAYQSFKKKWVAFAFVISICLLSGLTAKSQVFCIGSAMAGNITGYTGTFQTMPLVNAGQAYYWTTTLTAGIPYTWSNCPSEGGTNSDTYLRIYDASNVIVAAADDICGVNPIVTYTPPTTGLYYVHLSQYSCGTLATNQVIAYRAVLPPAVSSFSPASGCGGSVSVVITGSNFTGATAVTFGGTNAQSFSVNSPTQITAVPSFGTTGTISVTTPSGSGTSAGIFTINAAPAAPTPVTANPATICPGATTNLVATSAGNTISWYTVPSGGVAVGSSASGANFPQSPVVTTTYYAEASAPGGLGSPVTFAYTGAAQTYTVPAGVTQVQLETWGAQGAGGNGGNGGYAKGNLAVSPGQVLNLYVGGQTAPINGAAFNGGGIGHAVNARNGGGASDVRVGGVALANRVIVAGGGGSSSGDANSPGGTGGGGTAVGSNFVGGGGGQGYGGPGGAGGANGGTGNTSCHSGGAGGGGLNTGGAPSCNTCYGNTCGTAGTLGVGGNGDLWENGTCYNSYGGTSGGGGGYYGGGGTSVGNCGGGGGGGGSSWTGSLSSPSFIAGNRVGNGQIVVTPFISGCPSQRTPVTVTMSAVAASPSPVTATPASICAGATSQLNSTGTAGATQSWYTVPSGGVAIGTSLSGANFPVTPAVTTTYYAENSGAGGAGGTQTFNYTGAVQNFTVPAGVTTITIDARGAQGGTFGAATGGLGAKMVGDVSVTPGQVLSVWVGQQGVASQNAGGGGGASGVTNAATPLVVAGAGGGGCSVNLEVGKPGLTTTTGGNSSGAGGAAGNGGQKGYMPGDCGWAGGGGGFLGDGYGGPSGGDGGALPGSLGGPAGGKSRANGGAGGIGGSCGFSGLGSGGWGCGGGARAEYGGGGGGGYSGGGGGQYTAAVGSKSGGGGGSFNSGANQVNTQGFQSGNGQVIISWAGAPSCPSTRVAVTVTVNPTATTPNPVTATPATICDGATSQLNSTGTAGATQSWYTVPSGGVAIGTSLSGANFPVTPAVTTTYYAENAGAGGAGGTQTFNYTGAVQTFTVPAGVTSITVDARGGKAGNGVNASIGGNGGRVQGSIAVTPGAVLNIYVGGQGINCATCPTGAYNGGGGTVAGVGQEAGTGGGGSDIRVSPYALANRLFVAGGGGGGGYTGPTADGGAGGGLVGANGQTWNGYAGGTGGTQAAGGIGGPGQGGQPSAQNGSLGQGGNGQGWSGGGGGGGGGYYGGGGGFIGGGGGGSNFADPVATGVTHTQGFQSGNGQVIISWAGAPSCPSTRVAVTVTVNPIATTPNPVTATPATICDGATSQLNSTGTAGAAQSWYTVPSGGVAIGTSLSGANFPVTPAVTTTYYAENAGAGGAGGTQTFNYTGAVQTFTVPAGVTSINILAKGAEGGGSQDCANVINVDGGLGGTATGDLAVIAGQILNIYVGQKPTTILNTFSPGGYNGGGSGGQYGGPGGGSSDVRVGGIALANRVIVAGGGGGGNTGCPEHGSGGAGGGLVGGAGTNGGGGFLAAGGGTQIGGGAAGSAPGVAGALGIGAGSGQYHEGAGGGGYYGGGSAYAAGGGGGSSYIGGVTGGSTTAGVQTGNGQVIITWAGAPSCPSARVAVTVTVNPTPNVSGSATPATICSGSSTVLTGGGATSYAWDPGALVGSPTVSPLVTTNYTVTGTDANGCTATSTVEVVVNGTPPVTASASPVSICIGGSSTLTGGGASTYAWDPGALVGSPTVSPIATTNYTVTGTDANGCTATSTVDVVVNGLPVVTANPATQTVCEMGMATVSGGGAATYAWTGGISDATPFMVMAPAVYTVTGTDANGCTNTATAEVLMNTLPVITAGATPATTCDMTTVTPSASGAITIGWSGGLTNNVPFVATATTTYTVTGTDGNGCTNSTTVLVTVNPMSGILAPATSNQSQDHGDDFDINYYAGNCDLIATVDDGAGGNVLGMTTSTVNVDATAGMHNGQPFVRRWYQITPTTNGAADVVLYINQSDFDDYNAAVLLPYLPLPILGNNADPNIANIRITKNADAGLGNSPVVITPTVNWNGTYWELSFNTPNFSQFRVHSVNPGNVPLPVTITHFSGLKLETSDKLSWTTSSEQNNAYFNLQHSTDGIHFTTLAKVNSKAANGNSATPLTYTHTNTNPKMGHNYYRLQQTDLDNKLSVHAQIVDLIWGANGSTVSIYPNPTTDILNIDLYAATAQNTTVKLLDMSGRVIKQIQAKSAVGMNNIKLSMGEIASGVYTIQVYENNTLSHTSKVKKND